MYSEVVRLGRRVQDLGAWVGNGGMDPSIGAYIAPARNAVAFMFLRSLNP